MPTRPENQPSQPASSVEGLLAYWDYTAAAKPESITSDALRQAVQDLDEAWFSEVPNGALCLVSGSGLLIDYIDTEHDTATYQALPINRVQDATVSGQGMLWDFKGEEARNQGFAYVQLPEQEGPQFWLLFTIGDAIKETLDGKVQTSQIVLCIDPQLPRSVVPLTPFSSAAETGPYLEEASYSDWFTRLVTQSNSFRRLTAYTGFRRLRHRDQLAAVDRTITESERVSGVMGRSIVLAAEHAYATGAAENGEIEYQRISNFISTLEGRCWGIGMLGHERFERKAIRSDKDLIDKYAGFCLLLELTEENDSDGLPLEPGTLLQVPLSGQQVKIFSQAELAGK